jgi:Glycosyl transferase family 2
MSGLKLTVVVAVEFSQRNLPDILEKIMTPGNGPDEVIITHTENSDSFSEFKARYDNVVFVEVKEGSRIPQMWAEGIRNARGDFIALTTAHCVPEKDWVQKIAALDMPNDLAGLGGVFRNSHSASALDWAVFLQRYRQYAINGQRREVAEIAADNAVYRKTEILACSDLLAHGFWEPEFHARFRGRGLRLVLDPSLVVIHRNLYTFRQFAAQRIEHGTEFGLTRAKKVSALRHLALLLISPALWLVFLQKIVTGSFRVKEYRLRTLQAFPWLLIFVICWGFGESRGYYYGLSKRLRR